jgi:tRNA modification GTPase
VLVKGGGGDFSRAGIAAGLAGGLGQLVSELRGDLLEILAELEARLLLYADLPPVDVPALVHDITGA